MTKSTFNAKYNINDDDEFQMNDSAEFDNPQLNDSFLEALSALCIILGQINLNPRLLPHHESRNP